MIVHGHTPSPTLRRLVERLRLSPVHVVTLSFAAATVLGTGLLLLPASSAGSAPTSLTDAAFTATSTVCLTGLITADTAVHWTPSGHGVIVALIQVGGLGIMTLASLVVLLLANRIGLKARMNTAAEVWSAGG